MFGVNIRGLSFAQWAGQATAPSGLSPECIWDQRYDTQAYVSAATTLLNFFQTTNVDPTITNMQAAGQFPDPQFFGIHDICCDFVPGGAAGGNASYVSTVNAANTGQLSSIGLLMFVGRPIWTLSISDKNYGPYSLTVLHGTGAVQGYFVGTGVALDHVEYGHNTVASGWNYCGSLIIPPKVNFLYSVRWAAAQTLVGGNMNIRLSQFGVMARRVV